MNFTCDQCHKAYSIGDEKVAGRKFRVTCKKCKNVISVDASAVPHPLAAAARPTPAPDATPSQATSASKSKVTPASRPARTAPAQPAAPTPPPALARSSATTRPRAPAARAETPRPAAAIPPGERPLPSPRPAAERSSPTPAALLEAADLESTDQQDLFFEAAPTHRPRYTAQWLLADRKARPYRWLAVGGAVALVVGGVATYSSWSDKGGRLWAPEASTTPRRQAAPSAAAPTLKMPAIALQGKGPETAPQAADLPPDAPLEQRGGAPPRAVGGQAGFESAGSEEARERLRRRNLSIGKKDQNLLDLLDKKQDAAPAPAAVARGDLDTGRAELDATAVRRTMASNQAAFGACITKSVKENPNLRVDGRRVTLMLTIRPSGVVTSAWLAEADLDKSPLGKCLVGAARRVVFPAFSGEPLDVAVPLGLASTF